MAISETKKYLYLVELKTDAKNRRKLWHRKGRMTLSFTIMDSSTYCTYSPGVYVVQYSLWIFLSPERSLSIAYSEYTVPVQSTKRGWRLFCTVLVQDSEF
jgi:hypothetical protein